MWHAENLTLPHIAQFAVINCGINSTNRDTPENIAKGILSVGLALNEKKSDLVIIVTDLLPRDYSYSCRREKIASTNGFLKQRCGWLKEFIA